MILLDAGPSDSTRLRSASDAAERPAADYLRVVALYRSGDGQGATAKLREWGQQRMLRAVAEVLRTSGGGSPSQITSGLPSFTLETLVAAGLLHVELALAPAPADPPLSGGAGFQLGVARRFLSVLAGSEADPSLVHDLYLVVTLCFQGTLRLEDLDSHLTEARKAFPESPAFLLALGSLREVEASPRLTAARQARRVRDRARSLEMAEEVYREALSRAPGSSQVCLRLGRVLQLTGRLTEAAPHFQIALASEDPATRYLAWMFLGAARETSGELRTALDAYTQAAKLFPSCQTPLIASARALRRLGNRTGAEEFLRRGLAPAGAEMEGDPWVLYDYGQAVDLRQRIAELRARLREP